ncbi:hypothetical protein [Pseudonocardia zijingensis]|uniref:Alpha-L-rhamnosidase-like protein n=1 Tax=Pseudonocardia zijingensis TaxID=153376 RepID=A0ABP4A165_9PSEU
MTGGVEDLLARFTDPGPQYGPLPIWWWSGARVTRERLRAQMERLVAGGVRQAVVLCLAPTGPMFGSVADDPPFLSPEWLELFDAACADAEELGFTLWLYDQIGFSGANFQGRLVAAEPEFAGRALFRTERDGTDVALSPPAGHEPLAAYAVLPDGERVAVPLEGGAARWTGPHARVVLVHAGTSGFDYFSPAACAALLDQVHGTMEKAVGHWFARAGRRRPAGEARRERGTSDRAPEEQDGVSLGPRARRSEAEAIEHSAIGGFFQDELPPMPTWGHDFAATFTEAYGYDLLPQLWALWEPDASADAAAVRRDYHAHRAALARRGFFDQHDAWFAERGLVCGFDQASPAREGDPVGGVHAYGDYLGLHRGYAAPGSDHWGDAKVHSSLAHAGGHERTWIEAFHSSGWGGTLEETYDWLAAFLRRGATLYDPHAVYYSTVGGWWEWAPPSTCWRQPYWPSYPVFATAVARLCAVLTAGEHVADVLLLSPTTTAQAHVTLAGPLPDAERASRVFHELNGVNSWLSERRGVLERAGVDHDALDEATLAAGEVRAGALRVGAEDFRTVVLPAVSALHAGAAQRLLDFAAAGGRVLCVERAPDLFPGDDAGVAERFAAAVADGTITLVGTAEDVPAAVRHGPVRVRADAPFLLRRHGDAHVLALTAHDEHTGTEAPILDLHGSWLESGFTWQGYNDALRSTGYRFRPPGDRVAHVRVAGIDRPRAQSWSPGTGRRTELDVTAAQDGAWELTVPFDDGAVALVVLAPGLPDATADPLGPVEETIPLPGPWRALPESTLDNRWGDLAAADRGGVLPIEAWRLEHATTPAPEGQESHIQGLSGPECGFPEPPWTPVTASFGTFALVRGPWGDGTPPPWRPVEWSLARGLRDDPAHAETLGPKGRVPEEFLDWRHVAAGERVAVRTHLPLPDRPGLLLAMGAGAPRRVLVDGAEVPVDGAGHLSFSPLPAGRTVAVEIELTAERDGPLRAGFAVVTDADAYRRPEWMLPGGPVVVGGSADLVLDLPLDAVAADARVHVGSDGACQVLVNGVEVGRQGDFQPYPGHREVRVHDYDLGPHLRAGVNEVVLRVTNQDGEPTAATLDSPGLGVCSGPGWRARRDDVAVPLVLRRRHPGDPAFVCAVTRPHPLPGAAWLDPAAAGRGVVLPVVPDVAPGPERTEWLRLRVPAGTVGLRVPTTLPVTAFLDGAAFTPVDGVVRLPAPAPHGTDVLLRLIARDGRRGGALLDGPVELEVVEAEVPLVAWEELGLRALGGQVTYRTALTVAAGGRCVLDLGEVRGTADVRVNGALAARLVWGPWRAEVTDHLRPGGNEIEVVVRGTLAGYLDDASPTAGVYAGQVRTGLFGPVVLRRHRDPS